MAAPINKQDLEHLAKLARIELDPREEDRLLADLLKILDHFKELQALDTKNIPPMAGGTDLMNVFRNDAERENTHQGAGKDQFPAAAEGFVKVPPVFEE